MYTYKYFYMFYIFCCLITIIILLYHRFFYIKSGTILFSIENDNSAFGQAVSNSAINNIDNLAINHTALALKKNKVMEATPENGVTIVKLKDFLKKSKIVFAVSIKDKAVEKNAIENSKKFIGKRYNYTFEPDNDGIYCSQLITESFLYSNGNRYFSLHPMNFLNENGVFIPFWVEYYKKYNSEIPQSVPGSHPKQLFMQKNLFKKIWKIK